MEALYKAADKYQKEYLSDYSGSWETKRKQVIESFIAGIESEHNKGLQIQFGIKLLEELKQNINSDNFWEVQNKILQLEEQFKKLKL